MSELTKYMKALAKEREESWQRYSALENKLIDYHQQFDELADAAGIDTGEEKWWDASESKRYSMLIDAIRAAAKAQPEPANTGSPTIALADVMEALHNRLSSGTVNEIWPDIEKRQLRAGDKTTH
jgi:hypothetical protein